MKSFTKEDKFPFLLLFLLTAILLAYSIAFRSFGKWGEKVGLSLSKIYAICCIFAMIGGWNLFQINAMTAQFVEVTGGESSIFANNGWILGTIVAVITWFTIIGGIKAIGKFTSKVTPVMCSLYVISAFLVCIVNIHHLPETVSLIARSIASGFLWERYSI